MGKRQKDALPWGLLAIIVISGSVFYLGGCRWGLPMLLHPDEGTIVNFAINMAKRKSFEPNVFFRPDHLIIQINMLLYSTMAFIAHTTVELTASQHLDWLYQASRIITGLFGIGTIFVSYVIGKKQSNVTGLIWERPGKRVNGRLLQRNGHAKIAFTDAPDRATRERDLGGIQGLAERWIFVSVKPIGTY